MNREIALINKMLGSGCYPTFFVRVAQEAIKKNKSNKKFQKLLAGKLSKNIAIFNKYASKPNRGIKKI